MTYQSIKEGAIETSIDYSDAIILGFTTKRISRARGYVSRKIEKCHLPVMVSKRGELYVDVPAYDSTRYCLRIYLVARDNTDASNIFKICVDKSEEYNIPIQQTIKRAFSGVR